MRVVCERCVYMMNVYFYSNLRTPFIAQGALYKIRPKRNGKSLSSGNLGSGRDTLTVGKISSSGNHITSSGNALAFYSQHQVHETRSQMQQNEMAELRETDRRRKGQIVEILRVMRDMRREMGDMQAELLALREQQRRAR
ncbi:hypothetical protein Tco_0063862, partial [Tanacetum coccineum]